MRLVLVGGAPGIGKTAAARQFLLSASSGSQMVQWIDVDALWLHQPWRVDERTKRMVRGNLAAVMRNAADAGVDVLLVTWVFQSRDMPEPAPQLAPQRQVCARPARRPGRLSTVSG